MLSKDPAIAPDSAHYDQDPAAGLGAGPAAGPEEEHRQVGEGLVRCRLGAGFFRPDSRPARDLGVLLAAQAGSGGDRLRVLELMAGCGIRAARYGIEAGAGAVWANDGDGARRPWLEANLAPLAARGCAVRITSQPAQSLLAACLGRGERFELVDLDAFGSPSALVPLVLELVAYGGVLYLASSDGRSPTGHDRAAAVRRLGAAARVHPASWELALRLQLGQVARAAWAAGRGVTPLLSFSEGRTFRTAVRLQRRAAVGEERQLGLVATCHRCGDQQVQSLLRLRGWAACCCPPGRGEALAVSGPLWIGALQDSPTLAAMAAAAKARPETLCRAAARLLAGLRADPGLPARCWPTALIGRQLGAGPPALGALVQVLRDRGHRASVSGVMAGQVRTDAPWPLVLQVAAELAGTRGGTLNT